MNSEETGVEWCPAAQAGTRSHPAALAAIEATLRELSREACTAVGCCGCNKPGDPDCGIVRAYYGDDADTPEEAAQ